MSFLQQRDSTYFHHLKYFEVQKHRHFYQEEADLARDLLAQRCQNDRVHRHN